MPCALDGSCQSRTTPSGERCAPRDGVCYAIWEANNRELSRAEYHAALKAQLQAAGASAEDIPARLQRLGVPTGVILAMLKVSRDLGTAGVAWQKATDFTTDFGGLALWLGLFGATGAGKSTAACRVLWEWCRRIPDNSGPTGASNPLVWLSASKLTSLTTWNTDHTRWCEELTGAVLLVVDDMGNEGSEQGRNALVDVLMARHDAKRRTVVTSNLLPDAFEARYGTPLRDRISASGLTHVFDPRSTPSYRKLSTGPALR